MEDSNVTLERVGKGETEPVPVPPDPGERVIVMGAPQQDLDTSFVAYRQAIRIAEAARQQAIAAALAGHRRVLEDIEAAYRRDVAAARWCYSQRIIEPTSMSRLASVTIQTQRPDAALPNWSERVLSGDGGEPPGRASRLRGHIVPGYLESHCYLESH